jgi:gamma-glutamyl-gamma-aminobutyrate hydrolase PuuD
MIQTDQFLLLEGGVDVDSRRYGKKRHYLAQPPNVARDERELLAIAEYQDKGLPIIGICRGAQLICVANGGELWQHSDHHDESHGLNFKHGFLKSAAAGHHQIMRLDTVPEEEYKVIAWCPFYTPVYDEDNGKHILEAAPEVVWFPKTKCLAIQPHPEWESSNSPFRVWIDAIVKQYTGLENVFNIY